MGISCHVVAVVWTTRVGAGASDDTIGPRLMPAKYPPVSAAKIAAAATAGRNHDRAIGFTGGAKGIAPAG
jgi:hypothetical protein